MKNYAVLRLLLAGLLIYFAWPLIPLATTNLEKLFWGVWLLFFVLVIGANFSTLLQMTSPPVMEQQKERIRQTHND